MLSTPLDSLKSRREKDQLELPEREIVFLDHHRRALAHFPLGRLDDKPDIVGVIERPGGYERLNDGTYRGVPYHRVETVVEAKAIYGEDGQAQATRYAFNVQQARPDRPGFYCLSIKPQHFQVVYSSPVGVEASNYTQWTDLKALCAYVYSLYDPPDGHILYDRTLTWKEPVNRILGEPTWSVVTRSGRYDNATIAFIGNPWGRRTTVFRVKTDAGLTVMIKESYVDTLSRYEEAEVIKQVHAEGFIPGVVRYISQETVSTGNQEIVLTSSDGSLTRKKRRIVLADVGSDLENAETVNDILMAVYDALEVHRTLARDRHVLHRDMSIYNLLMYPTAVACTKERYVEGFPPLIDDILEGKRRSPEEQKARCLLIDFDNSALLLSAKADATSKELTRRTGTPMYIARAVSCGKLCTSFSEMVYEHPMPELTGKAKASYIALHGEKRYQSYNDNDGTIHGGSPPKCPRSELEERAMTTTFYHRWEYDAESIFWTMYSVLLRVLPKGYQEDPARKRQLEKAWTVLREHTIPMDRSSGDNRVQVMAGLRAEFLGAFPDLMGPVAHLLDDIREHVTPAYPLMDPPPPHDDHLHEAMQRLILQYLFDHRDDPIPLTPGLLRAVEDDIPPVINRGKQGETTQEETGSRGEKRRREAEPDSRFVVRRSTRLSRQIVDPPEVLKNGSYTEET
ncbi:hypothetical protein BV20DRAFT_939687 [Pilatotrama ljubarskyi]|nr:hypothetical protein BV20DRAFT_939687 [Pilatotrama ljubarskyi]